MKISESEMELMNIIWQRNDEITSADLIGHLAATWKPTTIQTFLKRLCDKGVLTVRKEGKTNFYKANVTEDEYKQSRTQEFLKEMHKGSIKSLLKALFDSKEPDKKDIEEIKDWFDNV